MVIVTVSSKASEAPATLEAVRLTVYVPETKVTVGFISVEVVPFPKSHSKVLAFSDILIKDTEPVFGIRSNVKPAVTAGNFDPSSSSSQPKNVNTKITMDSNLAFLNKFFIVL